MSSKAPATFAHIVIYAHTSNAQLVRTSRTQITVNSEYETAELIARFDVIIVSSVFGKVGIKFEHNSKKFLYKFEKVVADDSKTVESFKDAKKFTHHNLETGTNNEN